MKCFVARKRFYHYVGLKEENIYAIQSKFGNRLSHQQCLITYYKKIKTLWKLFEFIDTSYKVYRIPCYLIVFVLKGNNANF